MFRCSNAQSDKVTKLPFDGVYLEQGRKAQGRRETEKHETGNRRMGQTEKTTETQRHRVTKKKENLSGFKNLRGFSYLITQPFNFSFFLECINRVDAI